MAYPLQPVSPQEQPSAPPSSTANGVRHTEDQARWSIPKAVTRRLYISHFFSTWNSRSFEFGAVLFLASIFSMTLWPLSIYALIRASSAICFGPLIGRTIDRQKRLPVVRFSIGKLYFSHGEQNLCRLCWRNTNFLIVLESSRRASCGDILLCWLLGTLYLQIHPVICKMDYLQYGDATILRRKAMFRAESSGCGAGLGKKKSPLSYNTFLSITHTRPS